MNKKQATGIGILLFFIAVMMVGKAGISDIGEAIFLLIFLGCLALVVIP